MSIAPASVGFLFLLVDLCFANSFFTTTKQGEVVGVEETARNGHAFTAFYGLPYAKPPVGKLRWQPPVPFGKWSGLLSATTAPNECVQNPVDSPDRLYGDEDCLYLNVFTRHPGNVHARRQVLVWLHGGAFIFGGAEVYRPQFIMEEDVVLVVVQYRLNIFGFLSTEDQYLPGNYGMLDQVEALRWVKAHIESFGGNPDNVHIFGMSAGGASVHYLMLSPLAKGLFTTAISMSGSALCWWANVPNPKEKAVRLAQHFGCPKTGNGDEIAKCLRQIPADKIIRAHNLYFEWQVEDPAREPMNSFSPRSDPEAAEPFLPEEPIIALQNGHINDAVYMLGMAEKEGIWRANYILPEKDLGKDELWLSFLANFDSIAPLAFGVVNQSLDTPALMQSVVNYYDIKNLPTATDKLAEEHIHDFVDALSDSMFNFGIDMTAKLHSRTAPKPTYYYLLKFPGSHSLANFRTDHTFAPPSFEALKYVSVMRMASHGTDMLLLFDMFPMGPMPERDLVVSRKFIKLIVDFARNEKPQTVEAWKPLDEQQPNYLILDDEFSVGKGLPFQDRMQFWQKLPVFWNYTLSRNGESQVRDEL